MGRKDTLAKFQILTAADLSADRTSKITNIQFLDNIGIQINNLTGTADGTYSVQVSTDYVVSPANAGKWSTLATETLTSGSPDPIYFDLNQLSAPWIRLIWTFSSGTGTADAFIVGKML